MRPRLRTASRPSLPPVRRKAEEEVARSRRLRRSGHSPGPAALFRRIRLHAAHPCLDLHLCRRRHEPAHRGRLRPVSPCSRGLHGHRGVPFGNGGAVARMVALDLHPGSGIGHGRHRHDVRVPLFPAEGIVLRHGEYVLRRGHHPDHLGRRDMDRRVQRIHRHSPASSAAQGCLTTIIFSVWPW